MALHQAYAPVLPEMDPFLFASMGEEVDGIPLSVLSALSRLGLDPRGEAARLSHLTRRVASDQLERMMARLPDRHWTSQEMRGIATGLVKLLPGATEAGENDQVAANIDRKTGAWGSPISIYFALALTGAVLGSIVAHSSALFDGRETAQPTSQSDSPTTSDQPR
jgi:hypothetical protein